MRSGGSWSGKVKRSARPSCQASQAARVATASAGAMHAGSTARITASLSLSQPCRTELVQLLTGWRCTCPVAGWNRVRILQDLACATPDILVRPDGRVTLRPPTAARLRYSLERTSLVRAPDRQAERGPERVGPFDQPLFAAASGSVTVTRPPCLRLRTTTPASHQLRPFCQLKPAACSVRPIV